MQKFSSKQRANVLAGQPPFLSFSETEVTGIKDAIPKGYRLATLSEAKLCYNTDNKFRTDAEKAGSMWVTGENHSSVCARAYYGLFRVDNPESKNFRPVTNSAHVAYVRDERISLSRQSEMKESLKNSLRREVCSILY